MFLIIHKSTYFYCEFFIHILCEIFVVSNYDEMNYNIVSGVFSNVFWSANFGYMQ
jgi:hypothetical protein